MHKFNPFIRAFISKSSVLVFQQVIQNALTHVEATRHVEEPFKGTAFKIQRYFPFLCQIAKPLAILSIRKVAKSVLVNF